MTYHKAIVEITGKTHCFDDFIYITPILFLWDLSTFVCHKSFMTTYITLLPLHVKHSLIHCYQQLCTWASDTRLHINRSSYAKMHQLPQSHCGDNGKDTLFSWFHICYAHLASVRSEYFCVSWITYDHLYYAPCFACWALFASLLPATLHLSMMYCYILTVLHRLKCMSCYKVIVVNYKMHSYTLLVSFHAWLVEQ